MTKPKNPIEWTISLDFPEIRSPTAIKRIVKDQITLLTKMYNLIPDSEKNNLEVKVAGENKQWVVKDLKSLKELYLGHRQIELHYKGKYDSMF